MKTRPFFNRFQLAPSSRMANPTELPGRKHLTQKLNTSLNTSNSAPSGHGPSWQRPLFEQRLRCCQGSLGISNETQAFCADQPPSRKPGSKISTALIHPFFFGSGDQWIQKSMFPETQNFNQHNWTEPRRPGEPDSGKELQKVGRQILGQSETTRG